MVNSLTALYCELDQQSRMDLYILCERLRNRSAAMLAAVVFGVVQRVARENSAGKVTIGLAGRVLLGMYGYREQFEAHLRTFQRLHACESGNKSVMQVECIPTEGNAPAYGTVALSKYIFGMKE